MKLNRVILLLLALLFIAGSSSFAANDGRNSVRTSRSRASVRQEADKAKAARKEADEKKNAEKVAEAKKSRQENDARQKIADEKKDDSQKSESNKDQPREQGNRPPAKPSPTEKPAPPAERTRENQPRQNPNDSRPPKPPVARPEDRPSERPTVSDQNRPPFDRRTNRPQPDIKRPQERTRPEVTLPPDRNRFKRTINSWNQRQEVRSTNIPRNARRLTRRDSSHYNRVVGHIGFQPRNRYYYTRHNHLGQIIEDLFFPRYSTVYRSNYRHSVYWRWGYSPLWLGPDVFIRRSEYIYRPTARLTLDSSGVNLALADIRDAMVSGNLSLINDRLGEDNIQIYEGGAYQYDLSPDDFSAMTADMLSNIQVTEMNFGKIVWLSPREIWAHSKQIYYDTDGDSRKMYVAYRLRKRSYDWNIVAFDSSESPLICPYEDFRYR